MRTPLSFVQEVKKRLQSTFKIDTHKEEEQKSGLGLKFPGKIGLTPPKEGSQKNENSNDFSSSLLSNPPRPSSLAAPPKANTLVAPKTGLLAGPPKAGLLSAPPKSNLLTAPPKANTLAAPSKTIPQKVNEFEDSQIQRSKQNESELKQDQDFMKNYFTQQSTLQQPLASQSISSIKTLNQTSQNDLFQQDLQNSQAGKEMTSTNIESSSFDSKLQTSTLQKQQFINDGKEPQQQQESNNQKVTEEVMVGVQSFQEGNYQKAIGHLNQAIQFLKQINLTEKVQQQIKFIVSYKVASQLLIQIKELSKAQINQAAYLSNILLQIKTKPKQKQQFALISVKLNFQAKNYGITSQLISQFEANNEELKAMLVECQQNENKNQSLIPTQCPQCKNLLPYGSASLQCPSCSTQLTFCYQSLQTLTLEEALKCNICDLKFAQGDNCQVCTMGKLNR